MRFRYTAISPLGDIVGGEIEASDRKDALRVLRRQSLEPVSVEKGERSRLLELLHSDIPLWPGSRLKTRRDFAADLAVLRQSGAAMDEALGIISEGNDAVCRLARRVRVRTGSGLALSEALRSESDYFDEPALALVAAGEASGDLSGSLTLLSDMTAEAIRTRADIRKSLIYPAALIFASLLVIILMVFYVLPTFDKLLGESSKKIPDTAQIIFAIGRFIREWGAIALGLLILGGVVGAMAMAFAGGRQIVDRAILRLPVIGSLLAGFDVGRALLVCGRLLEAGSTADEAVELAGRTCSNSLFRSDFSLAARRIREGASARQALSSVHYLPDRALRMIGIGEKSGSLPAMMSQISTMVIGSARAGLDSLITALPPILTILVGGVVASLVYAILVVLLSVNELAF